MRVPDWLTAFASILPEKHFWREIVGQTIYLAGDPANGIGVALTTAALRLGHQVLTASPLKEVTRSIKS